MTLRGATESLKNEACVYMSPNALRSMDVLFSCGGHTSTKRSQAAFPRSSPPACSPHVLQSADAKLACPLPRSSRRRSGASFLLAPRNALWAPPCTQRYSNQRQVIQHIPPTYPAQQQFGTEQTTSRACRQRSPRGRNCDRVQHRGRMVIYFRT